MPATKFFRGKFLCAISMGVLSMGVLGYAQTEKVLYSFQGGNDGTNPSSGLVADSDGNLFGTTEEGGSAGNGVVYELSRSANGGWTQAVIHTFQGSDGAAPAAGLVFDQAGNLFGTTLTGGKYGLGTVFRLRPSGGMWEETVIHSFNGADGSHPAASVVVDEAHNLYGTTLFGGRSHGGVVFQLTRLGGAWKETVLHHFTGGSDGIDPDASVILDHNGALYGTTMAGNVFKLTPPGPSHAKWAFKSLYNFAPNGGPLSPGTLLLGKKGVLYGTQKFGNGPANAGAVFQLTPPVNHGGWTATTIYRFSGGSDGLYPYAGVIADRAGNLYGTTAGDGKTSFGDVYRLTPHSGGNWTESTIYSFTGGDDGSGPFAGLTFGKGGVLHGTTAGGGTNGKGTIFAVVH